MLPSSFHDRGLGPFQPAAVAEDSKLEEIQRKENEPAVPGQRRILSAFPSNDPSSSLMYSCAVMSISATSILYLVHRSTAKDQSKPTKSATT
jgi:hypothetical protein